MLMRANPMPILLDNKIHSVLNEYQIKKITFLSIEKGILIIRRPKMIRYYYLLIRFAAIRSPNTPDTAAIAVNGETGA